MMRGRQALTENGKNKNKKREPQRPIYNYIIIFNFY